MTIIRPDQLFDQADMLVEYSGGQQVALRRAVSASYYGLFHAATITVADYVVGRIRRSSPEWSLAYRSVDHTKLREICQTINKQTPPDRYRNLLSTSPFTPAFRAYTDAIIELQQQRHDADYDPSATFKVFDVKNAISTARTAHTRFMDGSDDEKRLFVCLLIFQPR